MVRQKPVAQSISSPSLLSLWGSRYSSLLFLMLAGLLLFISSVQPKFAEQAHIMIANVTAPVFDVASRPFVHIANTSTEIKKLTLLQTENQRLRAENQKLRSWYLKALSLNTEVQALRGLANLKVPGTQSFVSTRVIADSGNAFVKSLLIPVGTQDGVAEKQAVVSEEGLIGRVVSSGENASRVLLMTDVNSRIPVMVEGIREKAILAGQNDDVPTLTHISKDAVLEEGARVLTSGHGGYFPLGLPVGRVVMRNDGQYGVQTFANMNNLLYVKVTRYPIDPNLIKAQIK